MSFAIVPKHVTDDINKAIDQKFHAIPGDLIMNPEERLVIFSALLNFYDETGEIPEFHLKLKPNEQQKGNRNDQNP